MKVMHKLNLIDKIGRELQRRFSYGEIDHFLAAFNIQGPPLNTLGYNSKWVYSKEALKGQSDSKVLKIAEELEIDFKDNNIRGIIAPTIWQDKNEFKLFISHLAKNKDKALRLKEELAKFHISGFVSHEDVLPDKEWQIEIERALNHMDAILCIHTKGFSDSFWTQQEVGFALGKGVKVISFKMDGEDPKGFIANKQAILWRKRKADAVASEICEILKKSPETESKMTAVDASFKEDKYDDEIPF